ncbi:MAG: glycerol-3-phosphate 1-O-acyltransferase PlsY [Pseudomonadota bacterium]|nr:glycerol-3-phosphate 1-O-acyltransferase PlsY [Pseudomonadota bacterium]
MEALSTIPGGYPVLLAALAGGYLLGSIPFGLLLTRIAGLGDLRTIGSGNIGATNVLRTGNRALAATTLLLDATKGTIAVLLAGLVAPEAGLVAGFGAFAGHCFPLWLRFRGGKGVATFLGILAAVAWPAALAFAVIWLTVAGLTRYSSLSALVAMTAVPVISWWWTGSGAALLFLLMALLSFYRHRENVSRLLAGTESRIGARASDG